MSARSPAFCFGMTQHKPQKSDLCCVHCVFYRMQPTHSYLNYIQTPDIFPHRCERGIITQGHNLIFNTTNRVLYSSIPHLPPPPPILLKDRDASSLFKGSPQKKKKTEAAQLSLIPVLSIPCCYCCPLNPNTQHQNTDFCKVVLLDWLCNCLSTSVVARPDASDATQEGNTHSYKS